MLIFSGVDWWGDRPVDAQCLEVVARLLGRAVGRVGVLTMATCVK
jgi:hypothetical protein